MTNPVSNYPPQIIIPTREQRLVELKEMSDDLVITLTKDIETTVATLEEQYPADSVPGDLSVKENYKFVTTALSHMKRPRIDLECNRKETVQPLNTTVKKINAACKPLTQRVLATEAPFIKAKKDFDESEVIRLAEIVRKEEEIVDRITAINNLPLKHIESNSAAIAVEITKLENGGVAQAWAGKFADSAREAVVTATATLNTMYQKADTLEIAAREVEKKEAERVADEEIRKAKEAKDLAEQKRIQAETQAKLDRQQAAIDEQNEAIIKQKADIEKAKADAAQKILDDEKAAKAASQKLIDDAAEVKRVADQKIIDDKKDAAEKADQEKEAARKAEEAKKNREKHIAEALYDLDSLPTNEAIIHTIIVGNIRHCKWED